MVFGKIIIDMKAEFFIVGIATGYCLVGLGIEPLAGRDIVSRPDRLPVQ
jgi:hypothetical protein